MHAIVRAARAWRSLVVVGLIDGWLELELELGVRLVGERWSWRPRVESEG